MTVQLRSPQMLEKGSPSLGPYALAALSHACPLQEAPLDCLPGSQSSAADLCSRCHVCT